MPAPPPGEQDLKALSERFTQAEARIRALIARAPAGDRRQLLTEALAILIALRQEDLRTPVITAYRAVRRGGFAANVADLADSLAKKLDRGAQTAEGNVRRVVTRVTTENLEEMEAAAAVAHVDRRGTRWPLGAWASMNTQTIGRQASSRGVADAVGKGGKVEISVGECGYCQEFAGEATVGQDQMPPFHPSCSCVASAA